MNPRASIDGTKKISRLAGLSLVLLGTFLFVDWGFMLEQRSVNGACDFVPIYYHTRFILQHQDPYFETHAIYRQLDAGGYLDPNTVTPPSEILVPCVYPPTALFVALPLGFFRWHWANLIWLTLSAASLVAAALLTWSAAADSAPVLTGAIIGFVLVNSVTVLLEANAAALAVGLCVIAVLLFMKQRLPLVGVICMAVSLCLKPHDAAFIWLFLVLLGGVFRRRALQTLLVFTLLAVPAILWVSHLSPHWIQEMNANISLLSVSGGVNDPGPTTGTNHVTNAAINLQTVFAVFANNPLFYNTVTYIISALLLLWLVWLTLRARSASPNIWLGLAAVSAFAMLPVYHRHHDARLLFLAVPACAMLYAERRVIGRIAISITLVAISLTGDFLRALLDMQQGHQLNPTTLTAKLQTIVFARPAPIALLVMTVFFLWLYARHRPQPDLSLTPAKPEMETVQLG